MDLDYVSSNVIYDGSYSVVAATVADEDKGKGGGGAENMRQNEVMESNKQQQQQQGLDEVKWKLKVRPTAEMKLFLWVGINEEILFCDYIDCIIEQDGW